MGIKYHQYGCGNDYGDDHYLTDNWNPDYDYGSQYVEVYFNINTPSYMHAKDSSAFGFASDETRARCAKNAGLYRRLNDKPHTMRYNKDITRAGKPSSEGGGL